MVSDELAEKQFRHDDLLLFVMAMFPWIGGTAVATGIGIGGHGRIALFVWLLAMFAGFCWMVACAGLEEEEARNDYPKQYGENE